MKTNDYVAESDILDNYKRVKKILTPPSPTLSTVQTWISRRGEMGVGE